VSIINFKRIGQAVEAATRFQSNVEQAFKQVNDYFDFVTVNALQIESQTKVMANDQATNVTDFNLTSGNSDFKFDNLIVGQKYRLYFSARMVRASQANQVSIIFTNDEAGTSFAPRLYFPGDCSSFETRDATREFIATTTKVRIRQSWTSTCTFSGGVTFMTLTKITNEVETTRYT
jgi:hypothetical protein